MQILKICKKDDLEENGPFFQALFAKQWLHKKTLVKIQLFPEQLFPITFSKILKSLITANLL